MTSLLASDPRQIDPDTSIVGLDQRFLRHFRGSSFVSIVGLHLRMLRAHPQIGARVDEIDLQLRSVLQPDVGRYLGKADPHDSAADVLANDIDRFFGCFRGIAKLFDVGVAGIWAE